MKRIICTITALLMIGTAIASDEGVVYASFKKAKTNRGTCANATFWVSSAEGSLNFLKFCYDEGKGLSGVEIKAQQILDFECTNNGIAGKNAYFAFYGYLNGAPRLFQVLCTDSVFGYEYLAIAAYHPLNLTHPVYERAMLVNCGDIEVLCPDN